MRKILIVIFFILPSFCAAMAEPLSEDESRRIYLKGIEYYNQKEYIKAVLEWDRIIDLTGKVDYNLKAYYQKAYNKVFFKQKLLKKGMEYYEQSKYAEAIEVFKNVIHEAPYDVQAKQFLNRSEEGLSKMNIAHEIQEGIQEGEQLLAQKEYDKALEKFRTVLLLDPENPEVLQHIRVIKDTLEKEATRNEAMGHVEKGRDFLKQNDFVSAMDEFNAALALDPSNDAIRQLIAETGEERKKSQSLQALNSLVSNGISLFSNKEYSGAREKFNSVLALDPQNSTALDYNTQIDSLFQEMHKKDILARQLEEYYKNGSRYFDEGTWTRSREEFLNAFTLDSNYKDIRDRLKKIDQKIEEERLSKLKDQQDKILEYLNAGISYYQIGEYKSAVFELTRCLELDSENKYAKEYLGKSKEALEALSQEEVSEDSPYYEIVSKLFNDAQYYYQVQDYPRVMNYLEKIVLLFPGNRKARDLMVKVTLKLDPGTAEKFLADHYDQATKEFHAGQLDAALKEFRMIVSIRSNYQESGTYIGKILEATRHEAVVTIPLESLKQYYQNGLVFYSDGRYEQAKTEWEKILADNSDHNIYRLKAIMNINKIELKIKYNTELNKLQARLDEVPKEDSRSVEVKQHYLKGIAFYMNGEYQKALDEWQAGLRIDPNNTKIKNNISKCRLKLVSDTGK